MEFNTFQCIVEKAQVECPLLFELEHDNIPHLEEILEFQKQHQIQLPKKYIRFLLNYGGGYFGYANIYSLDKNSYFYLPNHNEKVLEKFLYIADNECGDYYALPIEQGKCKEAVVFYNHDDDEIYSTEFADILEYLVKLGLKQRQLFIYQKENN